MVDSRLDNKQKNTNGKKALSRQRVAKAFFLFVFFYMLMYDIKNKKLVLEEQT